MATHAEQAAAAYDVSVVTEQVGTRMRSRLRGGAKSESVVWQKERQRLLIHSDSLAVRSLDGWLLANLAVETDQTGRELLQFVFFVGKSGQSDGPQAACTINAPSPEAALLIDPWGRDLQRVLWDGVLDAIEAGVARVAAQIGGPVTLGGFHADAKAIHVSVIPGEL